MKKNLKVYFAHPYTSERKGAAQIFLDIVKRHFHDWTFVNPFDNPLTEKWQNEQPKTKQTAQTIVEKDLDLIRECDIVIVYFPDIAEPLIGCSMEIFFTCYVINKPIFILTPFVHPWLKGLDATITNDLPEFLEKLRGIE